MVARQAVCRKIRLMSPLPTYTKAPDALARLKEYLPLASRQAALEPALRHLHQAVLLSLASGEHRPDVASLASKLGIAQVTQALGRLRADDLLVLNEHGEDVCSGYPDRVALPDVPDTNCTDAA